MKITFRKAFGLLLIVAGLVALLVPANLAVTGVLLIFFGVVTWWIEWVEAVRGNKKLAKKLTSIALSCVAVLISLCGVLSWNTYSDDVTGENFDFVVVLGAQTHGDQPSRTLRERLDLAYDYLTAHPQAHVVVSGGQGPDEDYTEAEVMRSYLIGRGIAPDRILKEEQASNTRENLYNSQQIAQENGLDTSRVLIITSEFHMNRARFIAYDLGMSPYGITSTTTPKFLQWNYYLREIFAFGKALFVALIN